MPLTREIEGFTLTQIIEGSPVATLVINADHRLTHWNRACEQLTGIPASAVLGTSEQWRIAYPGPRPILADLVLQDTREDDLAHFYAGQARRSAMVSGAFEAEDFFPGLGEGGRWLFFTASAIRNSAGEILGAIETLQDVTERRQAEAALAEKEAFLSQIVGGSSVATLVIDRQHRVTHWNHACEVLTGMPAADVIGTSRPLKKPCSTSPTHF